MSGASHGSARLGCEAEQAQAAAVESAAAEGCASPAAGAEAQAEDQLESEAFPGDGWG
jgi:hypothetical protein